MGRVKLQIKKIENTTNRQVTFSKRRNGLIKKAYELSVLCDVDIALIMFSPSGRLSIFSGTRSIEDIIARYVNLPEHERGRLHNQEYLQRAIGKLKDEADRTNQSASPSSVDSQFEEIQQEFLRCKSQIQDMEKRLSMFEGDPTEITTMCEAEYREQVLEETLKNVRLRKQILEENYDHGDVQASSQVSLTPENIDVHSLVTAVPNNMSDWLPQRDPQSQILNFLDSNGLLSLRDETEQRLDMLLAPPPSLLCGQNMNNQDQDQQQQQQHDHMSPPRNHLMENHDHHEHSNINMNINMQRPEFGHIVDVNLSPWTHFYPAGNGATSFQAAAQPRERGVLELFLSQFTP